ncbi:hypothetical protein [Thermococcus prieurii]
MVVFLNANPKDDAFIKRWFPHADENQIKVIKQAVDNGLFDSKLGLGYGFYTKKNTQISLILENKEKNEEVTITAPYEIAIPYHAEFQQTFSGDVELVPNAATYGNKLLTAIARGIVLPNFHTWEFRLNARHFTNLVTVANTESEGSDVYPLMIVDVTSPVIYHVPYMLAPAVRLANAHYRRSRRPYFALDEAFHLALREVYSKYPALKAYEGEEKIALVAQLLDVFSMQLAGAVLAGLVEPGPVVFTGYNVDWFDEDVMGVIDWFWTFYRFPRASWDEVPYKEVDELFADIAVPELEPPERFLKVVMYNVEVGSELRVVNRLDWEFVRKQVPEFNPPKPSELV